MLATFINHASADEPLRLKLMTWNIRNDNPADGVNAWRHRKAWVADIINAQAPDIACFQEVLVNQFDDLQTSVLGMDAYGVGRSDGKRGGEFVPIFFRKERFELLEQGHFWLSPTPDEPGSKGWDAAITRIVTWVKLKDRQTERPLYVVNTHFDHQGAQARQESAALLRKRLGEAFAGLPILLAGDFNTLPNSLPYKTLVAEGNGLRLRDAHDHARQKPTGPETTFTGFQEAGLKLRIDYIFVSDHLDVLNFTTLDERRAERSPSDHLPVVAELELSGK